MLKLSVEETIQAAQDINDEVHAHAAALRDGLQKMYRLGRALDDETAAAVARDDREALEIFTQAQAQFEALKQPHLVGEAAQIDRFAQEWNEQLK
jgi:hypothetical protein